MSGVTNLDIRVPIGALFTAIGVLIAGYGLVTHGDTAMYARSTGLNVNLWWGAVMLVFGLLFLYYGRRAERRIATPRPGTGT